MTRSECPNVHLQAVDFIRRFAAAALAAAILCLTAACKTTSPVETTAIAALDSGAGLRRSAQTSGERYRANPSDPDAAIRYAQALRRNGQRSQAVAVLEQAAIQHPKHSGVLGAYGRALADIAKYKQAFEVLNRAHNSEHPDWRILSVQGAVLDQMGRHEDAQRYYATALRIAPDEPTVLSNLGLSYALSKDLVRAEATLRRAAGQSRVDARVRQNLALVVGLQGRSSEAESIADLPAGEAAAHVAYLRQVLAQQNGWKAPGEADRLAIRAEGS